MTTPAQDAMAQIRNGQEFRAYLRGGMAAYLPELLNQANRTRREHMIHLLSTTQLTSSLAELIGRTVESRGREHAAFILSDGRLGQIARGDAGHVGTPVAPAGGNAVGFVHTHPVPDALIAPPSANDYDLEGVPISQYQVQLVVETGSRRVWGVFEPRHSSLLGTLTASNQFVFYPWATAIAYRVVDGDSVRMARYAAESERARQAQERDPMRRLIQERMRQAEQRRRGAELRRQTMTQERR